MVTLWGNYEGISQGFVDAEVLKGYIEAHSPLKAADYEPKGEIIYKNK
ncbi:hypothetical protein [Morganella morganii]|nr:hypothetical protein [Morganella morganii]NGF19370.1 hypothetical protein [Morganella morganii]